MGVQWLVTVLHGKVGICGYDFSTTALSKDGGTIVEKVGNVKGEMGVLNGLVVVLWNIQVSFKGERHGGQRQG